MAFLGNCVNSLSGVLDDLKSKLRIAVIYGGNSSCDGSVIMKTLNTRPWKSYEAVARDIASTLTEIGFRHVFLLCDDKTLPEKLMHCDIQFAWLNTGGVQGYCPVAHTPAILEMLGIPYIGHDPLAAGILDSKITFKHQLRSLGIRTAPFFVWRHSWAMDRSLLHSLLSDTFGAYPGPFVVKPDSGRASRYVSYIEAPQDLPDAIALVRQSTNNSVLVEKYMSGREFCVAVCGPVVHFQNSFQRLPEPFAFAAVERILEDGEHIFTSMDSKPISNRRARLLTDSDDSIRRELFQTARRIYYQFDLKSIIRIDLRANSDGFLNVLEANPKPDLKRPQDGITSLVSMGLSENGMSYTDLILGLFADRLDYLFSHCPASVSHIHALLQALEPCPSLTESSLTGSSSFR